MTIPPYGSFGHPHLPPSALLLYILAIILLPCQESNTKKQQLASKHIALSLQPLAPINKEVHHDADLIQPLPNPPIHSKQESQTPTSTQCTVDIISTKPALPPPLPLPVLAQELSFSPFRSTSTTKNIDQIIKYLKNLANDTMLFRDTGNDPILSRGKTVTLPKCSKTSNSIPCPSRLGNVFHYDICYDHGRAIGGIHSVLLLVDCKTCKIFFGLKNLEHETILLQIIRNHQDNWCIPQEMIRDRYFRQISQAIDNFFEPHSQVSGAPSGRQSQNGLRDCNWKYYIYNITRNYMADKLLPSEFWFFAINYAVQLSNYLPVKIDTGTLTAPFFEGYGQNPDYRKLLPLFSITYVKLYNSIKGNTLSSQIVKATLVSNDSKSDSRLFYNLNTKTYGL